MRINTYEKLAAATCTAAMLLCMSACSDKPDVSEASDTIAAGDITESVTETENTVAAALQQTENTAYALVPNGEDVTAPIWLKIPNMVTLEKGDSFTVDNYISYIDDRDSDVTLEVTGEYDTSVVGEYPINLTITDDAGNSTTGSFTLNMVEPVTETESTPSQTEETHQTISFDDFITRYDADGVMLGIDVSKWQGEIDFDAVKNAGCDFVILRAMVYHEGELIEDSYFKTNLAAAKAAGLKVGVYIYTFGNTEEIIRSHAQMLAELLDGEELDFPIGYDWEAFKRFQQYHLSIMDLNNLFYAFADEMTKYGYDTMLYSSKYYLETLWYPLEYDVWLAHYTDETSYEGDYLLWQVNCIGRIDGIEGDVDINVCYMDGDN